MNWERGFRWITVVAVIYVVLTASIVINELYSAQNYPRHKEVRQKLVEIQKEPDEKKRIDELKEMAREDGASSIDTKIVGATTSQRGTATVTKYLQNLISEAELVQNINNALQTESMIDMCKTASRNYKIALVAAMAAWAAVLANILVAIKNKRDGKLEDEQKQ